MRVCAARWGVSRIPFPGGNISGSPPSLDAQIAAIAGRQHGVITTAQLVGAGLGSPAISKRAANGRLHRRYQGVYAVGQPRLSREGEWMAAILACAPDSFLASFNAAVHMRLWRRRVTGIHVLAPRKRNLPRVHVRAYRSLDRRDVTVRAGIPVTTVPRTLVDLSDVLTAHQLANVIHEAAFRKLFDERAVRAAMSRANGRHNLHVLETRAWTQRSRQRRHAQRARRPLSRSYKQIRPARTARQHQSPRHRGRLPLAEPESDRRGRRPRPHPPAHQARGPRTRCKPTSRRPHGRPRRQARDRR